MDAISYSYADKQAKRIKKFINNPDSDSGIVTVPKVIGAGENITVPAGRVAVLPNVQVEGTLNVEAGGEVFIPSGATFSKVVETEGNQTITGTKTFNGLSKTSTGDNALEVITSGSNSAAGSFMVSQNGKYGLALNGSGTALETGTFNFQVIDRVLKSIRSFPFQIGVNGVVYYNSFPVTPSSAPTTNYQVVNKKYVDDNALGVNQTWQNVTASRTLGVTYTNTTGKPIVLMISFLGTGVSNWSYININGTGSIYWTNIYNTGAGGDSIIIPHGSTYEVSSGGDGVKIIHWLELR